MLQITPRTKKNSQPSPVTKTLQSRPRIFMKSESNFAELVQFNSVNVSATCQRFNDCQDNQHFNRKSLRANCLNNAFRFYCPVYHGPS